MRQSNNKYFRYGSKSERPLAVISTRLVVRRKLNFPDSEFLITPSLSSKPGGLETNRLASTECDGLKTTSFCEYCL